MIHNFQEKFEFSLGNRETFDINVLMSAIVGCTSVIKTDSCLDKQGVDYIATLRRGAEIMIDAKTRVAGSSKYWKYGEPEFALEVWSVCPENGRPGKIGWTLNENSNVDMILFTYDLSDTTNFYLIPFQSLRMAFQRNYGAWKKKYGVKKERSQSWTSEAIFVPASVVMDEIRAEMTCSNFIL